MQGRVCSRLWGRKGRSACGRCSSAVCPRPPTCSHYPPAGATIPWVPRSVSPKIGLLDQAAIRLFDKSVRSGPGGVAYWQLACLQALSDSAAAACHMPSCLPPPPHAAGLRAPPSRRATCASCCPAATSWCTATPRAPPRPCPRGRSGGGGRGWPPRCGSSAPASSERSSPATTRVRLGAPLGAFQGRAPAMQKGACSCRRLQLGQLAAPAGVSASHQSPPSFSPPLRPARHGRGLHGRRLRGGRPGGPAGGGHRQRPQHRGAAAAALHAALRQAL